MTDTLSEGMDRPSVELGRFLLNNGSMSPDWEASFNAVPRSLFTPKLVWAWTEASQSTEAIDRRTDPEAWQQAVNSNIPLVTQWDDGRHEGTSPGKVSTSSLSQPNVVMSMLRDLDVRPGMKVLEAGTGPGWTAGLLAYRLGSQQVVSIEADSAVAVRTSAALRRAGLTPEVITGDGQLGWPKRGPYDRLIATYGVQQISQAWIEQVRPGGIILAPWGTHYSHRDAVVKLTVGDGGCASGNFTELVGFMKDRGNRLVFPGHSAYVPEFPADADTSYRTTLTPDSLGGAWDLQRFLIGLVVPDVTHVIHEQDDGTVTAWLYGLSDKAWACVAWRPEESGATVYQAGPRRLWQDLERALAWWTGQGQPGISRFGLTVTADGQTVWLNHPGNPVPQHG
ncbi:rRNA adenine N-6-methyltransferase family protein [Kitasatospora sp. NPDC101801]|uniref:rRNA adenine N-6-methyltransferase family protein n=1 Tax=Kitasatospora sp. NPDC101801 TaxID=3364103 RepID=UPI00380C3370